MSLRLPRFGFLLHLVFINLPFTESVQLQANWPDKQEKTKGDVLSLEAIANHAEIEWYFNAQLMNETFLTNNGSEQTLRMTMYNSGIYQVLASGFKEQKSKHIEITAHSK